LPNAKKAKARILVVEDHEANILVVTLCLKELGYAYDVAKSSRQALEFLESKKYALILMDIQMSGRDGIDTARIIRAAEQSAGADNVPIIALTADGDKERCLEAGMDDFILKPITLKILKEKLKSNL
jgi:two-component system sensor histidine kinase/response regulator